MNTYHSASTKKGFTLIELLVVIAIIGILASVVLASLNSARASARDAVIQSDIRNLQTALEMFRNADSNNQYPCNPPSTRVQNMTSGCSDITPYMVLIPDNPHPEQVDARNYRYRVNSTRDGYTMLFRLSSNNFQACSVVRGDGSGNVNFDTAPSCF